MNIAEKLELAKRIQIENNVDPSAKQSQISFGLVKSKSNGVRATFSKGLCEALELEGIKNDSDTDEIWVEVYPLDENSLAISRDLGIDQAYHCKLCGEGRRVAYNTKMVHDLVAYYQLDYSKRTSKTFYNIQFERYNGRIVAIVQIKLDNTKMNDN